MNPSALVLLSYGLWSMLFVVVLMSIRTYFILFKSRPANSFQADGSDVGPFLQRVSRVYANLSESYFLLIPPVVALATNSLIVTESAAWLFLIARFAQSLTHLLSTSNHAVRIRFSFFVIQLAISLYWSICLMLEILTG